MPPKKKISPGQTHGFIGDRPKSKPKPKEYNHPQWLVDYWLHRDRIIYSNMFTSQESKNAILTRYGKL